MARFARLVLLMLLAASYLPLSATTIPPDGKFPAGFWDDILSGRDTLRYGDPGWVKRMKARRETRRQIAEGKTTLAALQQDQFTVPVLLGRYSDASTTYDTTDFDELLFGDNQTGSFSDYYNEISLGQFQVSGKSYGWFDAGNPQSYYNNGTDDSGDSDSFVFDVVAAADSDVDYSLYDNDGPDGRPNSGDDDGYVDGVIVVFSGVASYQVEEGDTPNLWPVSSSLGSNEYTTDDIGYNGSPIKVNSYAIGPELYTDGYGSYEIHPIGVFAHEFGHVLGMPDLYDYTDENTPPDYDNSEGIGTWCLMAGGSWGGDGQHAEYPAHMSAWCKMLLGWVTPVTVEQESQLSIRPAETDDNVYRLWADPNRMSSYFLVENRQKYGFDRYLEGEGLMIYHVDEQRWWGEASFSNGYNNNDETHKLVDIEEADGASDLDDNWNQGDDGDPWPGSSGNTSFNSFSTPSSLDYDGNPTGVSIEQISSSGENITAKFTPAAVQGYGIAYDEQGISGWGWGYSSSDTWAGVLFTAGEAGTLEALDIGFRAAGNQFKVTVYSQFQQYPWGSMPSGALAVYDGTADSSGWKTIHFSDPPQLEAGQDFFVSMVIYDQEFSVSYDKDGEYSGRSYTSSDGEYFDDNFTSGSSGGDINIRARIRTTAPAEARPLPAVSIDTLAFGTVAPGNLTLKRFTLYNLGDAPLNAALAVSGDPEFSAVESSASLEPGDSFAVSVRFRPSAERTFSGSMTISGGEEALTVYLTGTGGTLKLFAESIGDETFTETAGVYYLWVTLNDVLEDPTVELVYSLDGGETFDQRELCEFDGYDWWAAVPAQPMDTSFPFYFQVTEWTGESYTLPANAPASTYTLTVALEKPGDLDGNWTVNIFDLLDLLKALSQPDAGGQSDVDGNGKVDIFDLLALLKLMGSD